ncbi:MAG TPA: IclR family transcriptional regulator [Dongiaceae bacterium]|jgi:DNA-binding IclR family transcriptional regulator
MTSTASSRSAKPRKAQGETVSARIRGGRAPAAAGSREPGVQRIVQLLEFVHRFGGPIRIGDLARRLNAPRSSVYALVGVLVEAGILNQAETGEVFFGKRLYFYGLDFLRENDLLRRGRDEVDRLGHETGETAQLCILNGRYYAVAHVRQGSRPFRINSDIGTQLPLPWTASGRLFLSHLSPDEIRAFVEPGDLRLPDGHLIEMEEFIDQIAEAREQGFCITSGLVDAYTHCIAVPLLDDAAHSVATLCFAVPFDTPSDRVVQLCEMLMRSAKSLSILPKLSQRGAVFRSLERPYEKSPDHQQP